MPPRGLVALVAFDGGHIRQQQSELFRRVAIGTPPKDDQRRRRLVCEREERSEIDVGRRDDAVLDRGPLEDDQVVRTL